MKLLIVPHNDDEMFLAFTIQREMPDITVLVVFDSYIQVQRGFKDCDMQTRRHESINALAKLGVLPEQVTFAAFSDADPPGEEELYSYFTGIAEEIQPSAVWIPAVEKDGHLQHNLVGTAGYAAFVERSTLCRYLTYTRHGKSTDGVIVAPTGEMIRRKLEAMSCYRTQIEIEQLGCWPHFLDLREYIEGVSRWGE